MRLSITLLFIIPCCSAFSQVKLLDNRKHFEYTDTTFEVGEVKILGNYNYHSEAPSSFDSLEIFLNLHSEISIEVGSHTDNKGNDNYNLRLSSARAQALTDALIKRGVSPYRLSAKGYGETLPIAVNEINGKDNPEGQQRNRRTEVKIISISLQLKSLDTRKHFQYTDTLFEVGEVKNLHNVHFGFEGGTPFLPGFFPIMDSVLSFLYYHPELTVEVGNHTDNKGNDKYNFKLSQYRARAIVNYLVAKGISSNRLSAKGYGETLFIAPNETPDGKDNPEGRQLNRRTELKIVSIASSKEKFIRPSVLNPEIAVTHFLFGENASAFRLSLFNVRAIENILDKYNQVDTSFISHYKSYPRSYTGFINTAGDSVVMATINFSSPPVAFPQNSVFNSNTLSTSQVLFINLSKRIYLTEVPSNKN